MFILMEMSDTCIENAYICTSKDDAAQKMMALIKKLLKPAGENLFEIFSRMYDINVVIWALAEECPERKKMYHELLKLEDEFENALLAAYKKKKLPSIIGSYYEPIGFSLDFNHNKAEKSVIGVEIRVETEGDWESEHLSYMSWKFIPASKWGE